MKRLKWIIPLVLVLAILLVPIPMHLKDGGTVIYATIAYRVSDYHRMDEVDGVYGYTEGYCVEIFGITVYEKTEFIDRIPASVRSFAGWVR